MMAWKRREINEKKKYKGSVAESRDRNNKFSF